MPVSRGLSPVRYCLRLLLRVAALWYKTTRLLPLRVVLECGFEFGDYLAVDFGLRYPTLMSGDADAVVAFGTDGEIFANGLRVLTDDKGLYPPYQVAPVVRQSVLDENPEIADALNKVAPLLNDATMQELNNRVTGEGLEPEDVARDFLVENGLMILTLGQYLQPTKMHLEVAEFIHPDTFAMYKEEGLKRGLKFVESGPLVRSSYHAERHVNVPF